MRGVKKGAKRGPYLKCQKRKKLIKRLKEEQLKDMRISQKYKQFLNQSIIQMNPLNLFWIRQQIGRLDYHETLKKEVLTTMEPEEKFIQGQRYAVKLSGIIMHRKSRHFVSYGTEFDGVNHVLLWDPVQKATIRVSRDDKGDVIRQEYLEGE